MNNVEMAIEENFERLNDVVETLARKYNYGTVEVNYDDNYSKLWEALIKSINKKLTNDPEYVIDDNIGMFYYELRNVAVGIYKSSLRTKNESSYDQLMIEPEPEEDSKFDLLISEMVDLFKDDSKAVNYIVYTAMEAGCDVKGYDYDSVFKDVDAKRPRSRVALALGYASVSSSGFTRLAGRVADKLASKGFSLSM